MFETLDLNNHLSSTTIRILEPSAGFGILLISFIVYLFNNKNHNSIDTIIVDAYETEKNISKILSDNLKLLKNILKDDFNVTLKYNVINENFIIANKNNWDNTYTGNYNIIISNPPFNKINQDSEEAVVMKDLIHGQPNLYSLFIAMSLKLLAKDGTYTVISPRNYLTGEYSKKIREYIFNNYSLCHIHTFDDRNIFKFVNQEIVISTFKNSKNQNDVKISHNGNFELVTKIDELIYNKYNYSIIIPSDNNSLSVFKRFKKLQYTLKDLGVKISVGPVVQFRNTEFLSVNNFNEDFAPLLIVNDVQNDNVINYYNRENNPKRKTHNKSINIKSKSLIKNSNYVLIRKLTAKDDKDIIVTSVLKDNFFDHEYIGLDNNLLYIHKLGNDDNLSLKECYGLYCYINSTLFEKYYSLINGTHTINVSDFTNIKFPCLNTLNSMGEELIQANNFSREYCTQIVNGYIFDK